MNNTELMTLAQTILLALALVIYFWQLRTYQKQLVVMTTSYQSGNIIKVFELINSSESRKARRHVIVELKERPLKDWSDEDRATAADVCATYDVAAEIASLKLVDFELVARSWAASLVKCYAICDPFIAEMRQSSGPTYWDGFESLAKKAREFYSPPPDTR